VNDLTFASNGDLYFTDQGQTGMHDPTGCVYRLRANGQLDCILDNVPSPNGLVLNAHENVLYLAVTRQNCVWRVRLLPDGTATKVGVFVRLSGGLAGPDGLALNEEEGLTIAHAGYGVVWICNRLGDPVIAVRSPVGISTAVPIAAIFTSPNLTQHASCARASTCPADRCIRTCEDGTPIRDETVPLFAR